MMLATHHLHGSVSSHPGKCQLWGSEVRVIPRMHREVRVWRTGLWSLGSACLPSQVLQGDCVWCPMATCESYLLLYCVRNNKNPWAQAPSPWQTAASGWNSVTLFCFHCTYFRIFFPFTEREAALVFMARANVSLSP